MARGPQVSGGQLWYGGRIFEDGTLEQFDEDCHFSCSDLSSTSPRSSQDSAFAYNMDNMDTISSTLGIPWEIFKDLPFSTWLVFISLIWDLHLLTVNSP